MWRGAARFLPILLGPNRELIRTRNWSPPALRAAPVDHRFRTTAPDRPFHLTENPRAGSTEAVRSHRRSAPSTRSSSGRDLRTSPRISGSASLRRAKPPAQMNPRDSRSSRACAEGTRFARATSPTTNAGPGGTDSSPGATFRRGGSRGSSGAGSRDLRCSSLRPPRPATNSLGWSKAAATARSFGATTTYGPGARSVRSSFRSSHSLDQ